MEKKTENKQEMLDNTTWTQHIAKDKVTGNGDAMKGSGKQGNLEWTHGPDTRHKMSSATDQVQEMQKENIAASTSASENMQSTVSSSSSSTTQNIGDKVSTFGHEMKDKISSAAGTVKDKVSSALGSKENMSSSSSTGDKLGAHAKEAEKKTDLQMMNE
jgi:hypothetical protein